VLKNKLLLTYLLTLLLGPYFDPFAMLLIFTVYDHCETKKLAGQK